MSEWIESSEFIVGIEEFSNGLLIVCFFLVWDFLDFEPGAEFRVWLLNSVMAAPNVRSSSSFSRNISVVSSPQIPGLKSGPNGTAFISSGIRDLDRILGGGYPLGSLVMVMEDPEAPHHMDLLRTYMSQGLVNNQPLLYASPSKDPKGFLGTLPHPASSKEDKPTAPDPDQGESLRIAWQYRKYLENQKNAIDDYSNDFDMRKPLERQFLSGRPIDCVSLLDSSDLSIAQDHCATFLSKFPRLCGILSYLISITRSSFESINFVGHTYAANSAQAQFFLHLSYTSKLSLFILF